MTPSFQAPGAVGRAASEWRLSLQEGVLVRGRSWCPAQAWVPGGSCWCMHMAGGRGRSARSQMWCRGWGGGRGGDRTALSSRGNRPCIRATGNQGWASWRLKGESSISQGDEQMWAGCWGDEVTREPAGACGLVEGPGAGGPWPPALLRLVVPWTLRGSGLVPRQQVRELLEPSTRPAGQCGSRRPPRHHWLEAFVP